MKFVLGCIGVVILGAVLLAGCFVFGLNKVNNVGDNEIDPVVDRYFEQFDAHKFDRLYAEIDENWRERDSEQVFTKLHQALYDKLGKTLSTARKDTNVEFTVGSSTAQVTYEVRFEKGDALATFFLSQRGGIWRIENVNYNSRDLLLND